MSIDGSFSLQSSYKRFLARCPSLKSVHRFNVVLEKGDKLSEDEVVNLLSELFLHEDYTIPLMGCFRPIARKVVERVVSKLRLVSNLESNGNDTIMETEDEDNLDVIEVYNRHNRGLDLHELACLAFCRALDLAPVLLGTTLGYFKNAPPPFQRLLASNSQLIGKAGTPLLGALRASLRLLLMESQLFSELWDWSCCLDLVQKLVDAESSDDPVLSENVMEIRWCTVQILSTVLKMSDRVTLEFGFAAEDALACLHRWEEFCQDVSLEKAGWYLEVAEFEKEGDVHANNDFNQEYCMQNFGLTSSAICSSDSNEMESLVKRRRLKPGDVKSVNFPPFVLTSAVKKSFEMVLLAVSQKWPVLLSGPISSGKSTLINELARKSGNRVLCIRVDEQMDGKTLIGSYVCTERPGEFRWQPGSLTQALLNGFWVVLEDFDKGPSDVQCIMLPLLEGATSFVTGRGEAIGVADSFRLFATISTTKNDFSHTSEGRISLGSLWRRVVIGPSSNKDLLDIVKAKYPNLEAVADKIIDTFDRVNNISLHQFGGLHSCNRFSLRDILKWCKRIQGLGFSFVGISMSTIECKSIYSEAVDIFAAAASSPESRLLTMKEIAKIWGVPEGVESLYPLNKLIVQENHLGLRVGRVILKRTQVASRQEMKPFVNIRSSLHVLERIACSVKYNEPVLLVGETGTGKTTLVQSLATRLNQPLTVLNLSQQSDIADLLGGLKPSDPRFIWNPLYKEFMDLFFKTYSDKGNEEFLQRLKKARTDKNWKKLSKGLAYGVQSFQRKKAKEASEIGTKRKMGEDVIQRWERFSVELDTACRQINASSCMAFSFVEGAFITALKKGHWILLDEINLAPPETLQRIIGVLEGDDGSICLAERGDIEYIVRQPDFRLFACMNPATDAGKRDLPHSVRSRFTEYFVDDVLDDEDLTLFIIQFLDESHHGRGMVSKLVRFYKAAKKESEERLQDGANQKPQFSLRSLYRALEYTKKAERKFGFQKALYDGFCMFFLTLLDGPSAKVMNNMILSYLLGGTVPSNVPFDGYLEIHNRDSVLSDKNEENNYILTSSVKKHLRNLACTILIKKYPVLLQGPTSSGKTSLVHYLASVTGHKFVRINNHEHTDLQEYLGSYVTDVSGKLVFQEGILVKAVRNGWWIVLDELNLAPSDVLEALNRLLDDNRELFVPELQETYKAHPDFMLFATQNPPTFYGGRKMLSRAFRNRFVEIHVDEIPEDELSTILEKRCKIPESYAKKMVDVMKDLQLHRQSSKVFAGKHGFITPRDLFRWAERFQKFGYSYEDLAKDGYFLLAERLRDESEKTVVQEVLEKRLRVKLVMDNLYMQESSSSNSSLDSHNCSQVPENDREITWTRSMSRLYFLVERCYEMREPVLLVGETGGGKTTVCQLLSSRKRSKLHILNCHQYTETSDFLGGFYPLRDRTRLTEEFKIMVKKLMLSNVFLHFPVCTKLSSDIGDASSTLEQLKSIINSYKQGHLSNPNVTEEDIETFEQSRLALAQLHGKWQTIFTWQDGPLVQAMKDGDLFLLDEISLADDSVLERLNSVLEPEKKLALAEKGGPAMEEIHAVQGFSLLATMNPGGDYGKKELSPALRNRFTEIWVPPVNDLVELRSIAVQRFLRPAVSYTVYPMINFWEWFNKLNTGRVLTVRDLLSWVSFINKTENNLGSDCAFLHGAFLVLLDGLSLGTSISKHDAGELRHKCLSLLLEYLKRAHTSSEDITQILKLENFGWGDISGSTDNTCSITHASDHFGISSFYISKGNLECNPEGFEFLAPTTCRNALRVLRAMQLAKPVLLEGSPGVGKTSLIVALGKYSGHKVVRINLSEQTDMMDLLGSDLPVESDEGMKFAWSDGILLQALKDGSWVLLDELNLAPQSVLEGLNAILDHRSEVFIPELGLTFKCPESFRVFACQNPSSQGGGRKSLPKSFLNRFTKVYVDELVEDDYLYICSSLHPAVPRSILSKLICFNKRLYEDTMIFRKYGLDGSPWEFNLRDVVRSCQIIEGAPEKYKVDCFLDVVYIQRMRTASDRREVIKLYEEVFGVKTFINPYPRVEINPQFLTVGNSAIERNHFQPSKFLKSDLKILPGIRHCLEAAIRCVQHQWLSIVVGPSSSGKTSLIRLLSHLTGNALNELNLSPETDSSDLLGCFEQYNAFRNFRSVLAEVEKYIDEYCSLSFEAAAEAITVERNSLVSRWFSFLSSINCNPESSAGPSYVESWKSASASSFCSLVEIIRQLRVDLEKYRLPVSWSDEDLSKTLKAIIDLHENYRKQTFSAKFEWVTGLLIKAIERGEWLVLENANLCNPTVLDRINSLVEPSGSITVNECGLVDGRLVVLRPHKKFRLFLTVNPRYGEISRAMRNRGVEIFIMQPFWQEEDGDAYKENEIRDVKQFLVLHGIPSSKLVDAMAEAHFFARDTGLSLGVHITLLELTRWTQLYQQLLMNGNMPVWSLQISWEHTYLSSLGDDGKDAVAYAKASYLSASSLSRLVTLEECTLALPGGWPSPMKLRNFISYSRETYIKQNCMYLEFLGAQSASYVSSIGRGHASSGAGVGRTQATLSMNKTKPFLVPPQMLQQVLYPTDFDQLQQRRVNCVKFDLDLASRMLFFAANWMIEQATERDLNLYLNWLSWYDSQLEPHCSFFRSYRAMVEDELKHPIWNCIFICQRDLISHYQIDTAVQSLPLLSLKLVDLNSPNEAMLMVGKRLHNAIQCVHLLRHSYHQWNAEDAHYVEEEFKFLFGSLRELEKKVLSNLIDCPCFNELIQLYTNLLECHTWFWKDISSSRREFLPLSLRSLKKDVVKLQFLFPEATSTVLEICEKTRRHKSMLWSRGGHPFLPFTGDIFSKVQQLLHFCDFIWPRKTNSKEASSGDMFFVEVIGFANTELRTIATEGVCMSSYITVKGDQDDAHFVQQLDEMHQMLVERLEYEKQKIKAAIVPRVSFIETSSACCALSPEMLCSKPVFHSWCETLPLCDSTSFSLDMELLQILSSIILVEPGELLKALSKTSEVLEHALSFSLKFSSRPPTDFVPHQSILWTLDAWESVDMANRKVAAYILEMWFKWHSSLWSYVSYPGSAEAFSQIVGCDATVPYMLFSPTKIATINHMLNGIIHIKDYAVDCWKLRIASGNIWQDTSSEIDVLSFLFSVAHSLLQQIVYAHRKSFDEERFADIKSIFCSILGHPDKQGMRETLISLISSSSHDRLRSSINLFIKPLLNELYLHCGSDEYPYSLGRAWLHIGGLRFYLLLSLDDLDPAMKYSYRLSHSMEKASFLELEEKVRQECEHLAGRYSVQDSQNLRSDSLKMLELEQRKLQRKVVFRDDSTKFTKLKYEYDEFLQSVKSLVSWSFDTMDVVEMTNRAGNWQKTATSFIDHLFEEYSSYVDIIQPVQVAIYEMKLGLSLILSSAKQKTFLDKVEGADVTGTLEMFMQFPRACASTSVSAGVSSWGDYSSYHHGVSANTWLKNANMLKRLCSIPKETSANEMVSVLQLRISHNILVRVTHDVCNSGLMDTTSFKLLCEIFDEFATKWMSMKLQTKAKEDDEAKDFRFKPRAFKIEDVFEVDVSSLLESCFFSDESLRLEWQELLVEEELTQLAPYVETGNLEQEWNLIQDALLNNMVSVHNINFGSSNLVECPGVVQISDAEKLSSFHDSYKLGMAMVKGLPDILACRLDSKLFPEHLLRLCLEWDEKFGPPPSALAYNFYKDSNAPVMAAMVDPVNSLKQRVISLLDDWPDHPGLQKIQDIADMLLLLPLSTPLAKVLSGLQFLLTKAQILEENAPRFSISDQLQPIRILASSWQKMEFECWPALLDGVQEQYDVNAGKLWFPLYSVLHRGQTTDASEDSNSTIQSLEEFIQTSSIGEFKKRLQLLLAFHGQINSGIRLKSYTSSAWMVKLKILYNVFGYYVQFYPLVLRRIEALRRIVIVELKEMLKLRQWERLESYLSIETSKRTRQKLRKLIKNFNDLMEQPVMIIVNQDAMQRGIKVPSMVGLKNSSSDDNLNVRKLPVVVDMSLFSDAERPTWYSGWRKKIESALQNLGPVRIPGSGTQGICFKEDNEIKSIILQHVNSQSACLINQETWKAVWLSLEMICKTATECAELWNDKSKSYGKRRALSDLLKLLENCGLSRHKSMVSEDEKWFLQPSYDVQHLLLLQSGHPANNVDITSLHSEKLQSSGSGSNWEIGNQYYYRSVAMVQLLRQICLNFHKDFSLDQVTRSSNFLNHLLGIQQEQRFAAYSFAEHLRRLRKCLSSLSDLDSAPANVDQEPTGECVLTMNQHITHRCMWEQKQIFDSLYTMSCEAFLLLRKVEDTHLDNCTSVRAAANWVLVFIEKFIPNLKKSKESLDEYLLGDNWRVTTAGACTPPFVVSRQMEKLVMHNFSVINDFREQVQDFCKQNANRKVVKQILLGRFRGIFDKGSMLAEEFFSGLQPTNQSVIASEDGNFVEQFTNSKAAFDGSVKETLCEIVDVFRKLGILSNGQSHSEELLPGNVTSWKVLSETCLENIQFDMICEKLDNTSNSAVELLNLGGHKFPSLCSHVQKSLKHLHVLLDLILIFGDALLLEFLAMHRTVAEMTHMLADVFASLYSNGFGAPEEQVDDTNGEKSKDASGTGMGEGTGLNDVSDQIEDENQILGTEKPSEGDTSNEVPNKNEKGIEMDQDFLAEPLSVSDDDDDEDDDDKDEETEDEKLESAMGETGEDGKIADETHWDENEENNPDTNKEKYESGPSVKDSDSSGRELRAKDDATTLDDSDEMNADKSDKQNSDDPDNQENDDENDNIPNEDENMDGMKLDKTEAYEDPTGIQLDERTDGLEEDIDMEEPEGSNPTEEANQEEHAETDENGNEEDGVTNQTDEDMEEAGEAGGNGETDDPGKDHDESAEQDLMASSKTSFEQGTSDFTIDPIPVSDTATHVNGDTHVSDSSAVTQEVQYSNSSNMQNGVAPSRGLPSGNVSEIEIMMPDSTEGGKLTSNAPLGESEQQDSSSMQRPQPNPCRSVGDALEKWKERVKVSVDSQDNKAEATDDMEDENADEYGFVSEFENGTSQALGPATSDQMDKNIKGNEPDGGEDRTEHIENTSEMDLGEQDSEALPVRGHIASTHKQKIDDRMQDEDMKNEVTEGSKDSDCDDDHDNDPGKMSGDLVSVRKKYTSEDILQLSKLTVDDEELGKAKILEELPRDVRETAIALWRKYELSTTRLSQELAEQLRLVMEPTIAGKLQGDYKTGKRINMKKVPPYVASDFRNDKIWLRRTRPNKRDYQVIVAVDDSRSMSESSCGNVAIESLVTVCRAMSQLEVGQLAVASFGKKGNIKLLQDFNQPFTGEAGIQMISSLTFKQENTIADEPVLDLLKYLNNKLDDAVANSRLPSGQNPLQQLILIIADGRFHEKERLKRCVRDVLNKKRMVAFLLLDSPQESIVDFMEASFQGEKLTFSKYLDSFPFPYYIILKNMEALPRTLGDLLKQWFELMQINRD